MGESTQTIISDYDQVNQLPKLPYTETILVQRAGPVLLPSLDITYPIILAPLRPGTAERLRACSRLRVFHDFADDPVGFGGDVFAHMRDIEAQGNFTGMVRSWIHGQDEILHLRLFRPQAPKPQDPAEVEGDTQGKGANVQVESKSPPAGVWLHYTDYKRLLVPLELLEEMETAEGMESGRWERGMEVSDAGWEILIKGMDGKGM